MNEPLWKLDAWSVYSDAMLEHTPRRVFALFSGGNDSTVLVHWARRQMGFRLDAAVFIDTGTALPGVRDFAEDFCAYRNIPLLVYEAGDAYDRMVLGEGDLEGPRRPHGFPGPAGHKWAYVRLKERQVEALIRDHKEHPRDRIMLLTGVRRSESVRRMGTTAPVRREGATVWVAPLIDWTDQDMRAYRAKHDIPESDVAALIHRSGECQCGAFAAPGEREMLRDLYPSWFRERILPLEEASGRTWGQRPPGETANGDVAPLCSDCQLRLEPVTDASEERRNGD